MALSAALATAMPAMAARPFITDDARLTMRGKLTLQGQDRAVLACSACSGADLVTLVRVLHDHDDATVLALLRKVWAVLPPGGRVMIAEPMRLPPGQGEVVDPYFHFYLLAMGAGRLRDPRDIARMLVQSGFSGVEQVPTAMPIHTQIVTAQKIGVNPSFRHKESIQVDISQCQPKMKA